MSRRTTIGQMREQIKILKVSDAPFGEYSLKRTFEIAEVLRAKKDDLTGSASRNGISPDLNVSVVFTVRRGPPISTEQYLQLGNFYYQIKLIRIVGSTPEDPRKQFLQLYCAADSSEQSFELISPEIPETRPCCDSVSISVGLEGMV